MKEFVSVRDYQVPEQNKFSVAVYRSRKMSYISRNESAFKCFGRMRKWNWQDPRKRWTKLEKYWKILFRKLCFSLITFCAYLVAVKVDLFVALCFLLLLGMLIGVDKRVGFRHAIEDEEYAFSYSKSRVKHRTP